MLLSFYTIKSRLKSLKWAASHKGISSKYSHCIITIFQYFIHTLLYIYIYIYIYIISCQIHACHKIKTCTAYKTTKGGGLVGEEPTPMWFRGRGPKIKPWNEKHFLRNPWPSFLPLVPLLGWDIAMALSIPQLQTHVV